MRQLVLPILVLALSASSYSKPSEPTYWHPLPQGPGTRLVVGALADISVSYAHDKPVTVIDILEFGRHEFSDPPEFLQVRLCGDYSQVLAPDVHTNVSVRYKLASSSRSIDCLSLMSLTPWEDEGRWHTIVVDPTGVKRNLQLRRAIRNLGHHHGPSGE